jgi:hypothetical protein
MLPRVALILAAIALVLAASHAKADSVSDFTLSGIFTDPFHDNFSLTGNMTVDGTTGLITSASLRLVGEPWTNISSQGSSGDSYDISVQTPIANAGCSSLSSSCFDTLTLDLSAPPSTLAADGVGSILSGNSFITDAGFGISLEAGTGSLTEQPSATPLPASLSLLATGLGMLGLLGWRRKQKDVGGRIASG